LFQQIGGGPRGIHTQHAGFGVGSLQGGELARHEGGRKEMSRPLRDTRARCGFIQVEKDEAQSGRGGAQLIALAALQGRAGEHGVLTLGELGSEGTEPAPPVRIRQCHGAAHLDAVVFRVKVVAFDEGPADRLGNGCAKTRFAATGDTHDDERRHLLRRRGLDSAIFNGQKKRISALHLNSMRLSQVTQ
jgi:hypothetical protein